MSQLSGLLAFVDYTSLYYNAYPYFNCLPVFCCRATWRTPRSASRTPSSACHSTWRCVACVAPACSLRAYWSDGPGHTRPGSGAARHLNHRQTMSPPRTHYRTAGALQHGQPVPPVCRVWPCHPEVRFAQGPIGTCCLVSSLAACPCGASHLSLLPTAASHGPLLPAVQLRQRAGHRRLPLALPAQQGGGAGADWCLGAAGQQPEAWGLAAAHTA